MVHEIPIDRIRPNPYNSRSAYTGKSIEKLAESISEIGQLSTIKVRPHPTQKELYQLVFGHRRYYAAKKLGWKTISAEVVDTTEEGMIEQSLIENSERENISDYELAVVFQRMNLEFHKTYEQIGKKIGVSRQVISNHIAMLRLFDSEELAKDPELARSLGQITEHHARVLSRVQERSARMDLTKMVVRKELSVRELSHIVTHLRSWFQEGKTVDSSLQIELTEKFSQQEKRDEISKLIEDYLRFAHDGDSDSFMGLHFFGEEFSMFDDIPPYKRLDRNLALSKKREWVSYFAPKLAFQIFDEKINDLGSSAVVTLGVQYKGQLGAHYVTFKVRGTLVVADKGGSWKIVHEHWSTLADVDDKKISTRSSLLGMYSRDYKQHQASR